MQEPLQKWLHLKLMVYVLTHNKLIIAVTLVYVEIQKDGKIFTIQQANVSGNPGFISALVEQFNFRMVSKIHTFTGDGFLQ